MSKIKHGFGLLLSLSIFAMAFFATIPTAYADTDGSELLVTDRPDTLTLELGEGWAGTQFELRFDFGTFPIPVTVNDAGVLTMELGGSSTYTLRLLQRPADNPAVAEPQQPDDAEDDHEPSEEPPSDAKVGGIPASHLVLFIGGLAAGVTVLIIVTVRKKRRASYYDDEDGYDEDD